jgi:hypothetical protein
MDQRNKTFFYCKTHSIGADTYIQPYKRTHATLRVSQRNWFKEIDLTDLEIDKSPQMHRLAIDKNITSH